MTYEVVILCLLIALIVLGKGKKKGQLFGAFLVKGKKGELGLKLWPAQKRKARR
ncbi:MAG: hypothetical protein L0I76_30465 [Pseudonocardia sp.]|nr:hypothetical protein [Pseudonocardia sp.]